MAVTFTEERLNEICRLPRLLALVLVKLMSTQIGY